MISSFVSELDTSIDFSFLLDPICRFGNMLASDFTAVESGTSSGSLYFVAACLLMAFLLVFAVSKA